MDWTAKAKCKSHTTSVFYPEIGDTSTTQRAIAICKTCSVRAECLAHAINSEETFGIWGGLTYRVRSRIAKSHNGSISVSEARKVLT